MKLKKLKTLTLVICLITSMILMKPNLVNAQILSGDHHEYIRAYNSIINSGGSFYSGIGQNGLHSGWSTNNNSFITNEMWIADNASHWIETGEMDGAQYPSGNYWAGHYYAYVDSNYNLNEYVIGSEYPQGGATFTLYNPSTSNTTWYVYVNGSIAATINMPFAISNSIYVGCETNDTNSTFNNGMQDTSLQYINNNGISNVWSYGAIINGNPTYPDVANLFPNWKASISSNYQTVTYTHN